MKRIALLALLLLIMTSLASADRTEGLILTDYDCVTYRATTASITSPAEGHKSKATICYRDDDDSRSFTPQGDTFLGINNANDVEGCTACEDILRTP